MSTDITLFTPTYLLNYHLRSENVLNEWKTSSGEDFEDKALEKMQMALQRDRTSV